MIRLLNFQALVTANTQIFKNWLKILPRNLNTLKNNLIIITLVIDGIILGIKHPKQSKKRNSIIFYNVPGIFKMKKVLVVDDNEDILNVISIVLDMEGFEVKCCDNGHCVSDIITTFSPDLILLDIMLGDMDGRDVCQSLKNNPKTEHIPVIMISASHSLYDNKTESCLADDFISKPFDIDYLAKKVSQHIN